MQQFQELEPKQKATATVAILVSVAIVLAAQRDLHRRSADEIHGPKFLWRLICLNALGAVLYFRKGRRGAA